MPEELLIVFDKVSVFQKDHLVLADVNFSINKGEFIYLIGKVGSGKSSLIKSINAQLPLQVGELRVGKFLLHAIKRSQISHLRRSLGVVFQDFQLLSDRSVEQNLAFVLRSTGWADKKAIEDRIAEVLDKVGLTHKGYKMPHQLSGGEQQRVVIARALLNQPDILLADEPTGNLDPETSSDIMKILTDIAASGSTVIMATHNYNLLKKFPARTLKCDDGKVTEVQEMDEIDLASL